MATHTPLSPDTPTALGGDAPTGPTTMSSPTPPGAASIGPPVGRDGDATVTPTPPPASTKVVGTPSPDATGPPGLSPTSPASGGSTATTLPDPAPRLPTQASAAGQRDLSLSLRIRRGVARAGGVLSLMVRGPVGVRVEIAVVDSHGHPPPRLRLLSRVVAPGYTVVGLEKE